MLQDLYVGDMWRRSKAAYDVLKILGNDDTFVLPF